MPKRKVTIREFVLMLKDHVVRLSQRTKTLEKTLEDINKKLDELSRRINEIEQKVNRMSESVISTTPPAPVKSESVTAEEDEFTDLAKELGLLDVLGGKPVEAPPVPPLKETPAAEPQPKEEKGKKTTEEESGLPFAPSTLSKEEVKEEELKKEKDELAKVLEELELI